METRTCVVCGQEKDLEQFDMCNSLYRRRQCHDCFAELHRQRAKARSGRMVASLRSRRKERRALSDSLKNVPCKDCGKTYPPYVMEFDHVSEGKIKDVTRLVLDAVPVPVLLAEVAKCEVVCANCHRERTHRRLREG